MQALSLPTFDIKIRKRADGGQEIFDFLRERYVSLTPEEWVRQHFVHYLTDHLHYPKALMANEVGIILNGMQRRCDTVIYYRETLHPRIIIEYKAPHIPITQQVFEQIYAYNLVLRADMLFVSNGLQHIACRMDYENQKVLFFEELPDYNALNQS